MTHIDTKIQQYIQPSRRVHLCGIGGVSMSPLAEVLHKMGLTVQGSEQLHYLLRERAGCDIPVARGTAQQQIPHRSAHTPAFIAVFFQPS